MFFLHKNKQTCSFSFFLTFLFLLKITSIHSNLISSLKQTKPEDLLQTNLSNQQITSQTISIQIDPLTKNCNLPFKEQISYSFNIPTTTIIHSIISKKAALFDFKINLSQNSKEGLKLLHYETYLDKSYKRRKLLSNNANINDKKGRITYRDRWLFTIELNKPVNQVNLEIEYKVQRGLMVDDINGVNLLDLYIINPYNYAIDQMTLRIQLQNFKKDELESLILPQDIEMEYDQLGNINLLSSKTQRRLSENHITLTLPMEIKTCDSEYLNYVYYGVLGMIISFIILFGISVFYLFKE